MQISILAYPDCFGGEAFGFLDLLLIANQLPGARTGGSHPPFQPTVVTLSGRPIQAAGAVSLGGRPAAGRVDLLVVPGFNLAPSDDLDARLDARTAECDYIRSVSARGVPVASICVGAFLLGAAGLLDGTACTTAWLYAQRLAQRYPGAHVRADELLVTDRGITTTAAFSASTDLALHLIGDHLGTAAAHAVSRITLTDNGRDRQSPYMDPNMIPDDGSFSRAVKAWLRAHLSDPYDLAALARQFQVSSRTLLRRFSVQAGQSPLHYLQKVRVEHAKRRLATSRDPVDTVMRETGYRDPATFRRLFTTHAGMSPSAYRQRFPAR